MKSSFRSFCRADKFPFVIQQLQRIPFLGIVTRRQDNTAGSLLSRYRQFDGRRRRQAQVDHVQPQTPQGAHHQGAHHLPADPAVTADYDLFPLICLQDPAAVGGGKFYNVQRRQVLSRSSPNRAPDAGNALYQCHKRLF
jgi:hypothetical protein